MRLLSSPVVWISLLLLLTPSSSASEEQQSQFKIDGTVIELDESNFESAISTFDLILVDFYAPWCGHCKRLAPQLDEAAPILAKLKEPVVIAKVNADKYKRLREKYEVDGFPMLMIFMHGVPTEYYGPRKAELLVRYLKKFVAPNVAVLGSDADVNDFIEEAGSFFPIYVGFGLDESVIKDLAIKYKKKAWFAVAKGFTDDAYELYGFDKVPALLAILPAYDHRDMFYGPFEEGFLEEFIKQNFLPQAVPINHDTLKLLKDDKRKIVLTLMEDESDEKSQQLIKLLKAAASANRDLVFAYVGVKQFEDFADTFEANKKAKLPKMVVWDGDVDYLTVTDSESIVDEEDLGSQITQFIEGYRAGKVEKKQIAGPSFMGYINSLINIKTVYIIVFLVGLMMLVRNLAKEEDEPRRAGPPYEGEQAAEITRPLREDYTEGNKED